MDNILINGGSGLLGGRLAEYFCSLGFKVSISSRKKQYIYPGNSKVNVKYVDWTSKKSIENLIKNFDIIFHLSSPNSNQLKKDSSLIKSSSNTTKKLMNSIKGSNVKKIVYFSSAHVYSSKLLGTIEEDSTLNNNHPYALNHIDNEKIIQFYSKKINIQSVILRVSNAFGHPIDYKSNCWSLFANDICRQAVLTKKIVINSDGQQLRDFITINNLCRAAYHIINIKKSKNIIYNIGGNSGIKLVTFLNIFVKRFEKKYKTLPELIFKKTIKKEENSYLDYRIDRIKKTGFKLINNTDKEIDDLIFFCEKNFK